jgi:hypothetical protein
MGYVISSYLQFQLSLIFILLLLFELVLIQLSLSTVPDTSATSDTSEKDVGCISNTVEPEEPEIEKDGSTITGTILRR